MSIFRKKQSSTDTSSFRTGRGGGAESLHTRESLTSPHPSSRAAGIPRPDRRMPKEAIGVARLLETYDEYAHLQQVVLSLEGELAGERERAEESENAKMGLEVELKDEKRGREDDVKRGKEDLKRAELEREKKIKGELEPKIKDLQDKLSKVELERDNLKKEVTERTTGMNRWITSMEKLSKERKEADEKERKASEDRKKLDERLKELDKEIITGMKGWVTTKEELEQKTTEEGEHEEEGILGERRKSVKSTKKEEVVGDNKSYRF